MSKPPQFFVDVCLLVSEFRCDCTVTAAAPSSAAGLASKSPPWHPRINRLRSESQIFPTHDSLYDSITLKPDPSTKPSLLITLLSCTFIGTCSVLKIVKPLESRQMKEMSSSFDAQVQSICRTIQQEYSACDVNKPSSRGGGTLC
jgi:hypothetical protein